MELGSQNHMFAEGSQGLSHKFGFGSLERESYHSLRHNLFCQSGSGDKTFSSDPSEGTGKGDGIDGNNQDYGGP